MTLLDLIDLFMLVFFILLITTACIGAAFAISTAWRWRLGTQCSCGRITVPHYAKYYDLTGTRHMKDVCWPIREAVKPENFYDYEQEGS